MFRYILLLSIFFANQAVAQNNTLSIEECYSLAKASYPLNKQKNLVQESANYTLDAVAKAFLPQVVINGQASYQSDVTSIPVKIPGLIIPEPGKDQYKLYAEATQLLYDGSALRLQQQLVRDNAQVEEQSIEVELFKLKERINGLYFGILLIEEQLKQQELLQKDIENGLIKMKAAYANGTILKSNVEQFEVSLLQAKQRNTELISSKNSFIQMLGQLINRPLTETVTLKMPASKNSTETNARPELLLYKYQHSTIETKLRQLSSGNRPKASLFVQAGAGRPALNMLSNSFDPYYVGGLRLTWSLGNLYSYKKNKAIFETEKKKIAVQEETFLYNTNYSVISNKNEQEKLQALLQSDQQIINYRENIKNSASSQLDNGIINSSDYLKEVYAEDNARLNKSIHSIQLLAAQYTEATLKGNE